MSRLFGIETEYGIVVEDLTPSDWINESIAVVRAHDGPAVGGWNYRGEDPRCDMRGFRVDHLSTDPDDAKFDVAGKAPSRFEDERSDRVLANGARFYNDHGHPEYSVPECRTLRDLVAHDKAGERIVYAAARRRTEQTGRAVMIYKNNTDFHGASYGTHECYLMRRDVPTDRLIAALQPFFATRAIYAGAGKVGIENETRADGNIFQLSQRADFLCVETGVDTLHNRPLVNTRDEPHATPSRYRRLHVICGDANMSEVACALKVGTTSLVLSLLEEGVAPTLQLASSVTAAKQVSRDIDLTAKLEVVGGPAVTALEVQRVYLDEAHRRLCGRDEDTDWVLNEWQRVLDDLETDPMRTADRLDWSAKYRILNEFRESEGLKWKDPYMQSLDLAYHNINPAEGLYYSLVDSGAMRRLVTEGRVSVAEKSAPSDTRAFIRGLFVERFGDAVESIGWNGVTFRYEGETLLFDMNSLVEDNVLALNGEFAAATTLADVVRVIRNGGADAERKQQGA